MARTDIHLDAMLRHLGAAYYESLHGRASRSDVARAIDTVEEHLREQPADTAGSGQQVPQQAPEAARVVPPARAQGQATATGKPAADQPRRRRYARRVRDVMTTDVVTIDRITPYKEIARLLTEHRISGVPVLTMGRHVAGVVSEADLLAAEDKHARKAHAAAAAGQDHRAGLPWRRHAVQPVPLVAGDLMSSPPVTIHPDATIPAAAREMNTHHLRRLPVVDPDGKLIGVVSRRDLLSIFLRPDEEIADDAQLVIDEILLAGPGDVTAHVHNGVVTLTGTLRPGEGQHADLVGVAIRVLWDIDGVVEVVNRLGEARPEATEPVRKAT